MKYNCMSKMFPKIQLNQVLFLVIKITFTFVL